MSLVAGVDGCRGGWFVVSLGMGDRQISPCIAPRFGDVLDLTRDAETVVIDMPIGLLDHAQHGGRECDREARKQPGVRGCTVFSPPVRAALLEETYAGALAVNRASSPHYIGISRQCFGIFPRLAEVDGLLTPELQHRIKESHPEVVFAFLNGGTSLGSNKHTDNG